MKIRFVRIDDRLMNGQISIVWSKEIGCNRIIVCNDEIALDDLEKQLIIKVVPPGINACVLSVEEVISAYKNSRLESDKTSFLFTNPTDVLRIVEGGINVEKINIGGMGYTEGKKRITRLVCVNESDVEAFKRLSQYGIELEIRQLVRDSKIILNDKLK